MTNGDEVSVGDEDSCSVLLMSGVTWDIRKTRRKDIRKFLNIKRWQMLANIDLFNLM